MVFIFLAYFTLCSEYHKAKRQMTKQGKVFALFVMSEQVSLIGTWWALCGFHSQVAWV